MGSGYNSDLVMEDMHSASTVEVFRVTLTEYKYNAFSGRINYNYSQELLLNLTGRRDGSSRFGPENRFHNFGSIAAGWIFTQRPLFKNQQFLSFGKIRASYGTVGNDQIGDYRYYNLYNPTTSSYPYQGTNGAVVNGLYNPIYNGKKRKNFR